VRERLLSLLVISEQPEPPPGAGSTLETFRASKRYLYYIALTWVPKQIVAFFGLVASLAFFGAIERPWIVAAGWDRFLGKVEPIEFSVLGWTTDLATAFLFFEGLAVVTFVGQFLFTGLLLKLSWELRWYMVGERALRIREGLWSLREQTMTIANIQTMIVRQNPVQRLLGIADLEVHTAGGGAGGAESGESLEGKSGLHVGRLRGLEDADGLRDRIRAQLIRHRGAGLGDADEPERSPMAEPADSAADPVEIGRQLLEEIRGLRAVTLDLGRSGGHPGAAV
jgi:membrane protein YdbS with pleckstrin-like domain